MAVEDIRKDLESDYGKRRGWACVAWKDREVEGHFEQAFFKWPQDKEKAVALIKGKVDAGCCVWKPTALLKEARRAEALPSNIISFEIDQKLSDDGQALLDGTDCTVLKSGRPQHYHVKVYLDKDLSPDDNAYWSKYFASACGITGHADSGGKFNPHDLLRIAGTRNTKPGVGKEVTYYRRVNREMSFPALRRKLKDFPAPTESTLALRNIDRIPIPEEAEIPAVVLKRQREPIGEDRSEQTYAFVQLCKEEGLPPGYIVELAMDHEPTYSKNGGSERRIMQDVVRCWNKGNRTAHEIEDELFNSTEPLRFLYREAKKRMACPTACLATALIHTGLAVPPWFMLPAAIGGEKTGVNLILAFVGPSGVGKGISHAPILEIDPQYKIEGEYEDDVLTQPIDEALVPKSPSSGPAIAAMFAQLQAAYVPEGEKRKPGRPKQDELVQYAYARQIRWDEIDTFNTYLTDSRNTIDAELRSAWTGAGLGTETKGAEGRITVKAGTYRLMVSLDAQPARCQALVSQGKGGLLQRIVFFNAWDRKKIAGDDIHVPVTRQIKLPREWPDGGFGVDKEIVMEIRREFASDVHVETEGSHGNTSRIRIAALLAVMHGSTHVNMKWWRLAGLIMEHSGKVKEEIKRELRETDREVQRSAGTREAIRSVAKTASLDRIKEKTEERIVVILAEEGAMSKGKVRQKLSRYQQGVFYEVLAKMIETKTVSVLGAQVSLKT